MYANYSHHTFEATRCGFPVYQALVQELAAALRKVLLTKDTSIFDFPVGLGLHLGSDFSQPCFLLVEIDMAVHLTYGVFD